MKTLLTTLLLTFSVASNATLIENGDYVSDTTSGLDWLKLNILNGYSYSDVFAGALGYTTNGWRFATKDELLPLVTNYIGPSTGAYPGFPISSYSSEGLSGAEYLVTVLGMNLAFNDSRASYNITGDQYEDLHQISLQGYISSGINESVPGLAEITASISIAPGANIGPLPFPSGRWLISETYFMPLANNLPSGPHLSSFLVRNTQMVPEPYTYILFALGLSTIGFVLHKKHSVM